MTVAACLSGLKLEAICTASGSSATPLKPGPPVVATGDGVVGAVGPLGTVGVPLPASFLVGGTWAEAYDQGRATRTVTKAIDSRMGDFMTRFSIKGDQSGPRFTDLTKKTEPTR